MPIYIAQQLRNALPKSIACSSILIYGAAYKRDIADYRESASIDLIKLLRLEGANVYYHDPYIPQLKLGESLLKSSELTPELLSGMDAVVIATDHSALPLAMLAEHAPLIYDTRNVTRHLPAGSGKARIVRLGAGGAETYENM